MTLRLHALAPLLLVAATAACTRAPESPATEQAAPLPVTTAAASMTTIASTFEAGGIVRARATAAIASRVMAPITEVRVKAGDRVRRGDPLVLLEAREMTANRDRALADVAAAQESVLAAEADAANADAALTLARTTHQRMAELSAKKSATPQELDQAVASLTGAEAQVRSAQARRSAALARRDAAQAASRAADTGLTYTQITAPFDAVVSERSVDPGAMAIPGSPLLVLEDPSGLRLEVRLDEARVGQAQVGRPVAVSVGDDASTPRSWSVGRISEIAQLDPASHSFLVKVDLPESAPARSGSFGRARFGGAARTSLTAPESALVRRGQLAFVFAVDAKNVARLRAVSTGTIDDGRVEVLAGLADGDAVVLDAPPGLSDGRSVQPTAQAKGGGR